MIFGKPEKIKQSKVHFYMAYMEDLKKFEDDQDKDLNMHDEESPGATEPMDDETFFKVERIVQEYNTIKQVLINNAIPVDLAHIASGGKHKGQAKNSKGWGMRVLFDKHVFQNTLVELEQMRKLHSVKKQFYLFHLPYFGKPKKMTAWHRKVEARTTQTLKFVNLARLLRIIQYDPSQYMSMQKLNQLTNNVVERPGDGASPSLVAGASLSGESYRNSLIE